ncbi:unnamed protein product, partial [Heterosigma akashiwo]
MRLELFFKSMVGLSKLASLIQKHPCITAVNLINKTENEPILSYCSFLRDFLGERQIDICAHYSLRKNEGKSADESFQSFLEFCFQAQNSGVSSLLLISGDGWGKPTLDTLTCLRRFSQLEPTNNKPQVPIGVVYNPFLQQLSHTENDRVQFKLESGEVSTVYLQIGSNLELLKRGLDYLMQFQPINDEATENRTVHLQNERGGQHQQQPKKKGFHICGSLLLPSDKLLERLRKKSWNGVYLDHFYLSSVENAMCRTREILNIYREYGVEPIIE